MALPFWLLWACLVPVVSWRTVRVARRTPSWRATIAAHLPFLAAAVLLHSTLQVLVARSAEVGLAPGWRDHFVEMLWLNLLPSTLAYVFIALAVALLEYQRRYRERDAHAAALDLELAQSRLDSLRAQLRPHFLFNTLNTVAMLVRGGDRDVAVQVVSDLSELLRQSLGDGTPELVPLGEELRVVERYLAIERARWGPHLECEVQASAGTTEFLFPPLALQPLVENAVRHGAAADGSVTLSVTATIADGALRVEVKDRGPGPQSGCREGIGMRGSRARLQKAFASRASLTLERRADGGAIARVTVVPRADERESRA
jgi:LytS/YehU family sensor histidine kinase